MPARPPLTDSGENYVEDINVESTIINSNLGFSESSSNLNKELPPLGILSSLATYGPLLTRLILQSETSHSHSLSNPQFSITLERTNSQSVLSGGVDPNSKPGGTLTLGGLPTLTGLTNASSSSSLTWAHVRRYTSSQNGVIVPEAQDETYPYAWEIPLDAVWFDGVRLEESTLGDVRVHGVGMTALVDTGNSLVRGPADVVRVILGILRKRGTKGRGGPSTSGSTRGSNGPSMTPPNLTTAHSRSHTHPQPFTSSSSRSTTTFSSSFTFSSASSRTSPSSSTSHSESESASDTAATEARAFISSYDPYDYVYPCSEVHELEFTIGGRDFVVDPSEFGRVVDLRDVSASADTVDGMWCVPALAPTDAPVLGGYLYSWNLGQPFLKGCVFLFCFVFYFIHSFILVLLSLLWRD